jgi:hypothetical protein
LVPPCCAFGLATAVGLAFVAFFLWDPIFIPEATRLLQGSSLPEMWRSFGIAYTRLYFTVALLHNKPGEPLDNRRELAADVMCLGSLSVP